MGDTYYGPNWDELRSEVIDEDGGCVVCFSTDDLHVHHRQPIKEFDSHEEANERRNLATLCERCHYRVESVSNKHNRRGIESFKAELESEGVNVPDDSFFRWLCGGDMHHNPDGTKICPGSGCFYPVTGKRPTCPSCGSVLGGREVRKPPRLSDDTYKVHCGCGYKPNSKAELISHIVEKHDYMRVEARKRVNMKLKEIE